METFENEETIQQPTILPKPVVVEDRKNWVRKSIISLGIYALLFIFLFDASIAYVAAVLVALIIHEFGHFFAMKAFNYSNVKLFVLPLLGAYVTGKKSVISQRQMTVVILAGPVPGILIGMGLHFLNLNYPNERIEMLRNIFLILNLFNLLPFVPLDGGRLVETLFSAKNHIIKMVFTIISILFLVLLAINSKSVFFIVVPIAMIFDLIMEFKNQKIRTYLNQENINYTTNYEDLPDNDYWTIRDCILLAFNKRYSGVEAGVHKYSAIEGSLIQHVTSILKQPFKKDLGVIGIILTVLAYIGIWFAALYVFIQS